MKNNNKLIGILGHKVGEKGYGQNAAYIGYFRQFGDVIILDAQCKTILPLDMLVLPGGRDVHPRRYGEAPWLETQAPDLEYEYFYENIFPDYLEKVEDGEMSIYGICAGFQNLIVEFGGSLIQDFNQSESGENRGKLVDRLTINQDPLTYSEVNYKNTIEAIQTNKRNENLIKTNSIHHQAALENNIKDTGFEGIAFNTEFGNVEFMIHNQLPIAAEQSHPEERVNPILSTSLIIDLLNL